MTTVAVFDLDGTLVPGNSFHRYVAWCTRWALRRGRFGVAARLLGSTLLRLTRLTSHSTWKRSVLRTTATMPAAAVQAFAADLAADVRPELVVAARAHHHERVAVALATAAPDRYVGLIAELLAADGVVATASTVADGWDETRGEAKWRRLQEVFGGDVEIETLYTDHLDDLPLIDRARRTVLVDAVAATTAQLEAAGKEIRPLELPPAPSPIGAIIVTHDSALTVGRALDALLAGALVPDPIVVVDSASADETYLDELERRSPLVTVIRLRTNAGFCVANDVGLRLLHPGQDVLLVNPDAFVSEGFVAAAQRSLHEEPRIGAVGPKLLGADAHTGAPTGLVDSAGITQSPWGRLRDRGQGQADGPEYDAAPPDLAALCFAAVLLRRRAVDDVSRAGRMFDRRFYMYKEDVDVSFRLRAAGWRLHYLSEPVVLHCRGWKDRRSMPAWARRRSLGNEWRLWIRGMPERSRVRTLVYLLAKSIAVALRR